MNPRLVRLLVVSVLVSACGGGTEPFVPVATTMSLNLPSYTLTAVGGTIQLSATVFDQNGDTMSASVTWTAASGLVATVSSSGLVTAVASGSTTVTATSGSATASAAITVNQTPAAIVKISGDNQAAQIGQALTNPLIVQVNDANANPVAGASVTFLVTQGTGAVSASPQTTNASGQAQVTWTLGTSVGTAHTVRVTTTPASVPAVFFNATATAGGAASVAIFTGNNQTGTVGQALGAGLVVRVTDAGGNSVAGTTVNFVVATGGGSLSAASAVSDVNGQASVTWTLGTGTGSQTVTATSGTLTGSPLTFTATAAAGAAASVAVDGGNAQTAAQGTNVVPSVIVRDAFGNVKPGVNVTFAVTAGGGFVLPNPRTTTSTGIASTTWTLGLAGSQTLTATVSGTGIAGNPVAFTATSLAPGAPASIAVFAGDGQTGLVSYGTNTRPAVVVRDASGNPVNGVEVTFSVATGGGTVTGPLDTTDVRGIAQVGRWTVGLGANSLTATATPAGLTANPLTFTATGVNSTFNIVVRFLTTVTPTQQAAFNAAAARWTSAIFGDVPDTTINATFVNCANTGNFTVSNETVDDIIVYAEVFPIDGVGGVIAGAGYCLRRGGGIQAPIIGILTFDSADLVDIEARGQLVEVLTHEMGHSLGLSSFHWALKALLTNPSRPNSPGVDTYFNGVQAGVAFDSLGGVGYTGGNKVPVENNAVSGTADAHWRETTFDNELMTGYIENQGVPMPLSILSIASMADLGYTVNLGAADAYTRTFTLRAGPSAGKVDLRDDIKRGTVTVLDPVTGRVLRVVER